VFRLAAVGVEGVEPPASCASCMRSNQLSYTPGQGQPTTAAGEARRNQSASPLARNYSGPGTGPA
jgi:hypothetical protein